MKSIVKRKRPVIILDGGVITEDPSSLGTWLYQSNVITNMIADYQVIHMRILVTFMETIQDSIKKSINKVPQNQLALFHTQDLVSSKIRVEIPLKNFGISHNNYPLLKRALIDLASIPVLLPVEDPVVGKKALMAAGLFIAIMPEKYDRMVAIEIDKRVAEALVNMDGGYTSFMKETVLNLSNKNAIKFYFKCCSWLVKGGFSMEVSKLREWLCVKDKYSSYLEFSRKVLKTAQKQLEEHANCWFEFLPEYRNNEKEPFRINFKVFRNAYTAEEQKEIDTKVAYLKMLWERYFDFSETEYQQIYPLLTLYNLTGTMNKTTELNMYLSANATKIKDKKSYCFESLHNYLLPKGDATFQEIEQG